jgi:hypothetical protein
MKTTTSIEGFGEVDDLSCNSLGCVWQSSGSKKTAPELQIRAAPLWSSFAVDLRSRKVLGIDPNFLPSL